MSEVVATAIRKILEAELAVLSPESQLAFSSVFEHRVEMWINLFKRQSEFTDPQLFMDAMAVKIRAL